MSEVFHDWIWGLTAAAIVTALAGSLCEKGAVSRVLRLSCGLLLLVTLLGPFRSLDWEEYAGAIRRSRETADELTGELQERNQTLERLYIEEECSAYILGEARKLGLEGYAEVRTRWMDEAFVPWEVTLSFGNQAEEKSLSALIQAELGIPGERQYWQ